MGKNNGRGLSQPRGPQIQKTKFPLWIKTILIHLGLIAAAVILFTASFPNLLFEYGLPLVAWFAYIPILLLIRKTGILPCIGWGAVYGYAAYGLFNYWLGAFHPMAGLIVYGIYLFYTAAVFLFLKLADILYPRRSYLVQWIIWLAFEYLQTKGFLGYSYGITGYSQWRIIPLIQIASLTGVWGVSAIVTFPSFWLAAALKDYGGTLFSAQGLKEIGRAVSLFFRKEKISAVVWAAALAAAFVFGFATDRHFSDSPAANIALIQHNTDPWEATKAPTPWQALEAYRKDLDILKRLSDEAAVSLPKPDMIVWPETAFVPRIYWHTTYRDDQDSWVLVRELLEYLSSKDIPFLIGNDDARMEPAKNPDPGEKHRVDYNAALFFENGQITGSYRKLHLVPFTEHFPYQKQLPLIYNALVKADTHFWEKGEEATVFNGPGFTFSTPICFEDIFGYLSRTFVRQGADVLVNISNDAWSKSLPCQNQHLAMAVFRAVENSRSMVRSTVSGQSCAIDPRGRVIAEAVPFTEAWLNVTVPLVGGDTFYSLYGDYLAVGFFLAAVILLISAVVWCIMQKLKRK
ncbi:MAG: apolipoprotein N-acyltransferase [Treponema sp.]|jgi:apolipoprotein N-acyltransferase|nr:apolipoprotein N-acyltransferase [Treponema sp.]